MRQSDNERAARAVAVWMELRSVQVGLPRNLGHAGAADPMDKPWTTGIFKAPVEGAIWLGRLNLSGDGQADRHHHGGPEKAVNVYPVEHYSCWAQELKLPDLPRGAFGENFTTAGLTEGEACIGDIFEVGSALVQVSQPRQPCWKLARRWRIKDLALRLQRTGRTGWYFRVLREGQVWAGARLALVERPHPEWTIAAANRVMHDSTSDLEAVRALAACPALSASWRGSLARRAATGMPADAAARLYGDN